MTQIEPTGAGEPSPAPRPRTARWLLIGLIASFAYVIVRAGMGPGSGRGLEPPALDGTALANPADFAWTLRDLDGAPVEFARYKGRPIVLNLWATWCPPCREEMPSLARLAAEPHLKALGLEVVCVSVDESAGALRGYLKGKDWGMTILQAVNAPAVFRTDGIPATFVIAPDGRVVASAVGSARWDDPSVVAFLERLAGPSDGAIKP